MKFEIFFILYCLLQSEEREQEIIAGPIVGRVTESNARILVEFESDGNITASLSKFSSGRGQEIIQNKRVTVRAHQPIVITFQNLDRNSKYFVEFCPALNRNLRKASFRTLKNKITHRDDLKIAFVSCNNIRYLIKDREMRGESADVSDVTESDSLINLWSDLAAKAERGEVDYVFHIGDQVYLDHEGWFGGKEGVYQKAFEKYSKENNFPKFTEEVREMIREEYRKTFNYPPTAKLLATVPNIMYLDDHEIHNDFLFNSDFTQKGTFQNFWMDQARYVYYQYQRQLREAVDFNNLNDISQEYYADVLNGIGVLAIDFRGVKTWLNNKESKAETHYLGQSQTDYIKYLFSDKGRFSQSDIESVVIISSIPIFMYSKELTAYIVDNIVQDSIEAWIYQDSESLEHFIDVLLSWKERTGKDILFIGGDVHYTFHTDIYKNKKPVFKQFTTSGIYYKPYNKTEKLMIDSSLTIPHSFPNKYCFRHHNWVIANNYGVIKFFKNEENGRTLLEMYAITTDRTKFTKEKSIFSNQYDPELVVKLQDQCCGDDCTLGDIKTYFETFQESSNILP